MSEGDTIPMRGSADMWRSRAKAAEAMVATAHPPKMIRDLVSKLQAAEAENARLHAEVARLESHLEAAGIAAKFSQKNGAELRARIAELEAERDRLRQERLDYSSVTTTEGLNASEWVWRTGRAERENKALRARIAELEAAGRELIRTQDEAARTATEAALRWVLEELRKVGFIVSAEFEQKVLDAGARALLGEGWDA